MKIKTHLQLESSSTMEINALLLQKRSWGEQVYNLCAGEPMIDTPDVVKRAVMQALEDNHTHYPPMAGLMELRQSAVEWMNSDYSTDFEVKNCAVTPGGKFGLFLLLQSLLEPGDEILIPAPFWVSYPSIAKLFGGVPVVIDTNETGDWKLEIGELEKMISVKTKVLLLNNASNPTGVLYTREELKEILDMAKSNNIIVISDEVYSGLVYDGEFVSCGSFEEHKDHVIIIQSCSKQFAMTGLRVGFVFGPEEIISIMIKLLGQSISGVTTVSQYSAIAGFKHRKDIVSMICGEMKKRRDVFVDTFNKLFSSKINYPASALYCFIPMSAFGIESQDSVGFCREVLDKANVAMVPGLAFGKEGYIRCAFGESEGELREGLHKLALYLQGN